MPSNEIKNLTEEDVEARFKEEHLVIAGRANIATMRFLKERITVIEKAVLKKAKLREEYIKLLTVPGIGKILVNCFAHAVSHNGLDKVHRCCLPWALRLK